MRTRREVYAALASCGFARNTGQYTDYEAAKALLLGGKALDATLYTKVIGWIAEYLKV